MSRRALLLLLLTAVVLGGLVLVLNPDYRIDHILESNAGYYPEAARRTEDPGVSGGSAPTDLRDPR